MECYRAIKEEKDLNRQLDLTVRRSLLTSEKAGSNLSQGEGKEA